LGCRGWYNHPGLFRDYLGKQEQNYFGFDIHVDAEHKKFKVEATAGREIKGSA